MADRSAAGLMVEVDISNIDEGRQLELMNAAISKAHAELVAAAKASGQKAGLKAKVTLGTIEISYHPEFEDNVRLTYTTPQVTPPTMKRKTLATTAGGRMLAQPSGTNKDDPQQLRMFTTKGEPAGVLDPETGELVEDETDSDVAGVIG